LNIEYFRDYCLRKRGVTEEFPFGIDTLVFKVVGKMFAITDVSHFSSINLKVLPETSIELQERHEAVLPGYHMNKKHWITVLMDNSVPDSLIWEWVDQSYTLVVSGLTKKQKSALESM
jgi:predicted DNA-binding protein (MmcQ/YjbR family)